MSPSRFAGVTHKPPISVSSLLAPHAADQRAEAPEAEPVPVRVLARPEIVAGIHEYGIAALARDVYTYCRAADMPVVDRSGDGFALSPAFNHGPHVAVARIECNERVLPVLLWPRAKAHRSSTSASALSGMTGTVYRRSNW